MSRINPSFAALLFSLTLVLTGQSMAVLRGSSDATGQMVLCIGTGLKTVYLDAQGNQTEAPHFCPECLSAGFHAVLPGRFVLSCQTGGGDRTTLLADAVSKMFGNAHQYRSRAPPLFS